MELTLNRLEQDSGFELLQAAFETGQLSLVWKTSSSSPVYVDVYDMIGRCLYRGTLDCADKGVNHGLLPCNIPNEKEILLLSVKQQQGENVYKSVMKLIL